MPNRLGMHSDGGDHAASGGIAMGRLRSWFGSLITGLLVSSGSASMAAERIVFRFGEFARDVSVPELRQFSETGAIAPRRNSKGWRAASLTTTCARSR